MKKLKQLSHWFAAPSNRTLKMALVLTLATAVFYLASQTYQFLDAWVLSGEPRNRAFLQWATGGQEARARLVVTEQEKCPGAPFILPAAGFIGLLYEDPRGPYSQSNPHQGIDIFSNTDPGVTAVYAAYAGYITREPDWKSTLIQRVPEDPLDSSRQVWLYYTHMADQEGNDFIGDAFPPGTSELFVEQGTLLGYTGNYNGSSVRDVWTHLHFSIVKDDGSGRYTNELEFANTLDPSPYLGRAVNYAGQPVPERCQSMSPAAE